MMGWLPNLPVAGVYGIWSLVAMAVLALIRGWPALRKMSNDADASLRGDLMGRIVSLEKHVERLEDQIGRERERHNTEMSLQRHALNNERMSLDALLMLLETNPDKAAQAVTLIKENRAQRAAALAIERGFANANINMKGDAES